MKLRTFNDYGKFINATGQAAIPDAKYEIKDITLEYEIITQPDIASRIATEYQTMALEYDRIRRHRKIIVNKLATKWNRSFNMTSKSLKDIFVLFEESSSTTQRYKKSLSL